jgi:hypothetical protein
MPLFPRDTPPAVKVESLESWMLLSAWTQGELAEERLDWLSSLVPLQDEWDHLTGWEHLRRTRTEIAVEQAKRMLRPDLYDQIQDHRWMIKRLDEEVDRMERESTKTSRAYTMVVGSG